MPTIREKQNNEQALVKAAIAMLRAHGFYCWRQNQGGVKASYGGKSRFVKFAHVNGISDIIGIAPGGKFCAFEAKVGRNKPTEDQLAFIENVKAHGGVAGVFYSLDELHELVKGVA